MGKMGLHQKALDRSNELICFVDQNAKIIFANKAVERFGVSRRDAIGKEVISIFPFLEKDIQKIFSREIKNNKWISYKGEKYYMSIESSILEKNVAMLVIRDMTQFKTNEKKLKEIKKLYEKILEIAHEGIYIENEDGEIVFANNAFSRMVGYSVDELVGRRTEDILRSNETKKVGNGKYEMKIYTKDGYSKILLASSHSFKDRDFIGRINLSLDITDKKKREEKLKILTEKERNFRLKTAHYFFNPLAIAKGYMGLMAEEMEGGEREKVLKAIHAISRVENVIKNFVTRGEIAE